jgi:hypothetical protein
MRRTRKAAVVAVWLASATASMAQSPDLPAPRPNDGSFNVVDGMRSWMGKDAAAETQAEPEVKRSWWREFFASEAETPKHRLRVVAGGAPAPSQSQMVQWRPATVRTPFESIIPDTLPATEAIANHVAPKSESIATLENVVPEPASEVAESDVDLVDYQQPASQVETPTPIPVAQRREDVPAKLPVGIMIGAEPLQQKTEEVHVSEAPSTGQVVEDAAFTHDESVDLTTVTPVAAWSEPQDAEQHAIVEESSVEQTPETESPHVLETGLLSEPTVSAVDETETHGPEAANEAEPTTSATPSGLQDSLVTPGAAAFMKSKDYVAPAPRPLTPEDLFPKETSDDPLVAIHKLDDRTSLTASLVTPSAAEALQKVGYAAPTPPVSTPGMPKLDPAVTPASHSQTDNGVPTLTEGSRSEEGIQSPESTPEGAAAEQETENSKSWFSWLRRKKKEPAVGIVSRIEWESVRGDSVKTPEQVAHASGPQSGTIPSRMDWEKARTERYFEQSAQLKAASARGAAKRQATRTSRRLPPRTATGPVVPSAPKPNKPAFEPIPAVSATPEPVASLRAPQVEESKPLVELLPVPSFSPPEE